MRPSRDELPRATAHDAAFATWSADRRARVERALDRALPGRADATRRLAEAMRYATLGGGKRMRALLAYAAGELAGAQPDDVDAPAGAVEMIHAYSLVHDDLPSMDDDTMRRGRPTCHVAFGEATALLAGDALQAQAFALLAGSRARDPAAACVLLAEAAGVAGMAGGQAIDLDATGRIDLHDLQRKLALHADRPLKLGSFSAASNVTGVLSDVAAIARVLHRGGAFAVFDYAAAGPYVPIDMHPADPEASIDALFLSTHKFVGGPQASGLLVASRALFRTRRPERPGGGTVHYVSGSGRDAIDYVARLDEREEGGTPAIIGDVRAGTAFLVREMVGAERIREHEVLLARRAVERLAKHPRIHILGPHDLERLAILSFNVEELHHDLVSVLLDHLFGIQNRAGCSCAGPYGHRLLGIDRAMSERFRGLIRRGIGGIKPGWVRVTIPFYASEHDVEFLLSAIEFVADHGRAFVPRYRLSWRDGVWRHVERPAPDIEPIELTVEALEEAAQSFATGDHEAPMSELQLLGERGRYLEEAREMARQLEARWRREPPEWNPPSGDAAVDELRWFDYVHGHDMPAGPGGHSCHEHETVMK